MNVSLLTHSCEQAEASRKGTGGAGGNGGSGGSRGTGGTRGAGGLEGVPGAGTGVVDLGQKDMGLAGWESKESTA